jgi:sugar fermentation stimulation protein A
MRYNNTCKGQFIDRPNRFIAHVMVDGVVETVHVKNTGRCRELLLPGVTVILDISSNPNRKTKYDLIAVYKEGTGLINMDSQAPNKVVNEWLLSDNSIFADISYIKPEFTYGKSRIDFYFEYNNKKVLLEVKGVTLERDKVCYFPDAPTERGVKHIEELTGAVEAGYECYIAFVIQMEGVNKVYPNVETHPEFGEALDKAVKAGVHILYLGCRVEENELNIDRAYTDVK